MWSTCDLNAVADPQYYQMYLSTMPFHWCGEVAVRLHQDSTYRKDERIDPVGLYNSTDGIHSWFPRGNIQGHSTGGACPFLPLLREARARATHPFPAEYLKSLLPEEREAIFSTGRCYRVRTDSEESRSYYLTNDLRCNRGRAISLP